MGKGTMDFPVPKRTIPKGLNGPTLGRRMYLVTKRRKWYEKKFTPAFHRVKVWDKDDCDVFMVTKKDTTSTNSRILRSIPIDEER